MSCRVITIRPDDLRIGSDPSRVADLPGFTHYLVSKAAAERVKKMLATCRQEFKDAMADGDPVACADSSAEINGIKYTMQTLGIPLK